MLADWEYAGSAGPEDTAGYEAGAEVRSAQSPVLVLSEGPPESGRTPPAHDFPLVVWDPDGVIRLANQPASDLVGLPLDDLVGRHVSDLVLPRDATTRVVGAVTSGALDSFRAKRHVAAPGRDGLVAWMWSRAIELDGRRGAATLLVPGYELWRLERDTSAPWRDLTRIAVGVADDEWRVSGISEDARDAVGLAPADCVGVSLLEFVHPDDAQRLRRASWGTPGQAIARRGVRLSRPDGSGVKMCVLAARCDDPSPGGIIFALVLAPQGAWSPHNRLAELELRLRRIGAEVRAAELLDDLGRHVEPSEHPQLAELTARQWEILSMLLAGERVPTIARRLFMSPSTVRYHLAAIFRKFGVHTQSALLEVLRRHPPTGPQGFHGSR
jgi:DNA-binding CsgD family transcriptional regulator